MANQTAPIDEILLYDDGSTDETVGLAESLGLPNLRILRSAQPAGISSALNAMLEATDARYIVRMDADDVCEPERVRLQLGHMDQEGLAVVGSWARRFGKADTLHRFAEEDRDLKAGLLFAAPFCHPTVIIDRQRLREPSSLRYDSAYDGAEDHDLWIRLRDQGRFGNVQRILVHWRLHDDNAGSHPAKLARQLEVQERLRERILADMGVRLLPDQLAALGKRCSSSTLEPGEHEQFLSALLEISRATARSTCGDPASMRKMLVRHWDLSCQFAVHRQPRIPSLWRSGRRLLGAGLDASTLGKLLAKDLLRRARGDKG